MHARLADALRRGQVLCDRLGTDLLDLDYHEMAGRQVEEVRRALGVEPKGAAAVGAGSAGAFDVAGMSPVQRAFASTIDGGATS
jgi:hypothetical protein